MLPKIFVFDGFVGTIGRIEGAQYKTSNINLRKFFL